MHPSLRFLGLNAGFRQITTSPCRFHFPASVRRSSSSQTNSLSALVSIIADATKVVEAHYSQVPSLDDVKPHPLDNASSNPELRNAVQLIEGACAQLSASVGRPNHVIVNKSLAFFESACLRTAMDFKIADILQENPEGMHLSEIGQKSGVEERKIGRILRLLATKHVFREVKEEVFANNRLSLQLLSTNPTSNIGLHFSDEAFRYSTVLTEVLADEEWGHSYSGNKSAFNRYTGYPGSMFEYFDKDKGKGADLGARFGVAMIGWGAAIEDKAVISDFAWNELRDGATVCDLGGGVGNISLHLAKKYPKLQMILQDLPGMIQQAKSEIWPQKCPEAIEEKRIQFVPVNFLTESPVAGCDVYFLKNIIHNWPNAECITILSNIKRVMTPHSRILVHEYILQNANRVPDEQSEFPQAPEPMLANYGEGRIRQYTLDLHMLTILNAEERRLSEFIELGKAAGLKFVKLWNVGETGLVEYALP